MSYTPTNWKTGDVVTSAKLNKLENGMGEVVMSYEPTVWKTGDVVTSAKLNKLENAVASAPTVTTFFDDDVTFTAVTTQWGTNYEAEVQLSSVPIEFPEYDADYGDALNTIFVLSTVNNFTMKYNGEFQADGDKSLMCFFWQCTGLSNGDCVAQLYSDGTLKLTSYNDWALDTPHFTFKVVSI